MLYLLHHFSDHSIVFNLFRYITFRSAGASVTAFFLSLWLGPRCIAWLKQLRAVTNQERAYAETIHEHFKHKKGREKDGYTGSEIQEPGSLEVYKCSYEGGEEVDSGQDRLQKFRYTFPEDGKSPPGIFSESA